MAIKKKMGGWFLSWKTLRYLVSPVCKIVFLSSLGLTITGPVWAHTGAEWVAEKCK